MKGLKGSFLVSLFVFIILYFAGWQNPNDKDINKCGLVPYSLEKDIWIPTKKVCLWNGRDFSGWKFIFEEEGYDATKVWSVKDGIIHCEGKPNGYMRTETKFTNFKLHVEWRWHGKGGNSGIYFYLQEPDAVWPIGKTIECQLYMGKAGEVLRRPILHESNEKPFGQWNSADIYCQANIVKIYINDLLQNEANDLPFDSGRIALQSEGCPIEFRNIYLEPLE